MAMAKTKVDEVPELIKKVVWTKCDSKSFYSKDNVMQWVGFWREKKTMAPALQTSEAPSFATQNKKRASGGSVHFKMKIVISLSFLVLWTSMNSEANKSTISFSSCSENTNTFAGLALARWLGSVSHPREGCSCATGINCWGVRNGLRCSFLCSCFSFFFTSLLRRTTKNCHFHFIQILIEFRAKRHLLFSFRKHKRIIHSITKCSQI